MNSVLALVFFVAALGAGCFILELVNRRPVIGAFALFAWLALLSLFIDNSEIFMRSVGGINVVPPDVICALLAAITILRVIQGRVRVNRRLLVPLAVFVAMLALSYIRGLVKFGLQHSTNEFREFFYFLSALLFSLSFPAEKLSGKLPGVGIIGGLALVLVACARIPLMGGFSLEARPVPSYAALAIGQAFFLGWFFVRIRPRFARWRWLMFGFLAFAFLMLHRSVWVALLGGIAAIVVFDQKGRRALLRTVVIGGAVGAVIVAAFFGPKVAAGLNEAVGEATSSEDSTFIWRLEGWIALLRPDTGWDIGDLLVGRPMGSGYARVLGNSSVNATEIDAGVIPHNYYLSTLLRGGIIGLLAFLTLHFRLLRLLASESGETKPGLYALCYFVILVTQMIYYVPYSADFIQGLFLGGAIALPSTPERLED